MPAQELIDPYLARSIDQLYDESTTDFIPIINRLGTLALQERNDDRIGTYLNVLGDFAAADFSELRETSPGAADLQAAQIHARGVITGIACNPRATPQVQGDAIDELTKSFDLPDVPFTDTSTHRQTLSLIATIGETTRDPFVRTLVSYELYTYTQADTEDPSQTMEPQSRSHALQMLIWLDGKNHNADYANEVLEAAQGEFLDDIHNPLAEAGIAGLYAFAINHLNDESVYQALDTLNSFTLKQGPIKDEISARHHIIARTAISAIAVHANAPENVTAYATKILGDALGVPEATPDSPESVHMATMQNIVTIAESATTEGAREAPADAIVLYAGLENERHEKRLFRYFPTVARYGFEALAHFGTQMRRAQKFKSIHDIGELLHNRPHAGFVPAAMAAVEHIALSESSDTVRRGAIRAASAVTRQKIGKHESERSNYTASIQTIRNIALDNDSGVAVRTAAVEALNQAFRIADPRYEGKANMHYQIFTALKTIYNTIADTAVREAVTDSLRKYYHRTEWRYGADEDVKEEIMKFLGRKRLDVW